MNLRIQKQFMFLLSFILVFAQLSFVQPIVSNAATLDQAVTITALDEEGSPVISTTAVEINQGDTAWDVLDEVAEDLEFDESEWGKMLQGINGVTPDFDIDGTFWAFIINGQSASVGLDAYEVKHGDNILVAETNSIDEVGNVTVSAIDEDGEHVVKLKDVGFTRHATAYDAIVQAIDNVDVSVDNQYFSFINNINNLEIDDNQFWELFVDDTSLQVGALSHQVQPGEHIQLRLQTFDDGSSDDPEDSETPDENKGEKPDNNDDDIVDENENAKDEPSEEETGGLSEEALQQVKTDINFLTNKILNENLATAYGDEWWVWGLGTAGKKAPKKYKQSIDKVIKETKGDLGSVTELEKVIIALSSQGYDATNVAGFNLIKLLENHSELDNPMINSAIYALIAMNSGDYKVDSKKEQALLQFVLDSETASGGWTYFGDKPSVDITGMALIALANYQDQAEVQEKIDRAVKFLSEEQDENGGFYEEFNGGYSSEAAAQAIIGLTSVGVNPTAEKFTKSEANLVEYLLQFRVDDGYAHVEDDDTSNPFANQQGLLALAYFNNYIQGQDNEVPKNDETNDDSSKNEPTDDKEPNENNNSEGKSKVTIKQGKVVQVEPGTIVKVEGTSVTVKLPKDLPSDATMTVKLVENVETGSFKIAGDIVDINLLNSNGKKIDGEFILTLSIHDDFIGEDVSIYYFDEATKTWEYVGGEINKDGTISVAVSHFSKYGVFLTAESDKIKEGTGSSKVDKSNSDDTSQTIELEEDTDKNDQENKLPNTSTNLFEYIGIGLSIILAGFAIMFFQRKKVKQS